MKQVPSWWLHLYSIKPSHAVNSQVHHAMKFTKDGQQPRQKLKHHVSKPLDSTKFQASLKHVPRRSPADLEHI